MLINQTDINRFWLKINFPKDDCINNCWIYNYCLDKDGYGIFWINKKIRAHRFSYIIHNNFEEIPKNMKICHKCDNPSCVNPLHLFVATSKQNSQDMVNKNRQCHNFGTLNGMSILTESEVMQILIDIYNKKYKTIQDVCKNYKIEYLTINDILHGKTWTHITNQLQIPSLTVRNIIIDKSENRNTAKLNRNDVYNIRVSLKNGISIKTLANQYSLHITTIDAIAKNKTWKTVII